MWSYKRPHICDSYMRPILMSVSHLIQKIKNSVYDIGQFERKK